MWKQNSCAFCTVTVNYTAQRQQGMNSIDSAFKNKTHQIWIQLAGEVEDTVIFEHQSKHFPQLNGLLFLAFVHLWLCINVSLGYETHLWVLALSSCGLGMQLLTVGLPASYPSRLSHHFLKNQKRKRMSGCLKKEER